MNKPLRLAAPAGLALSLLGLVAINPLTAAMAADSAVGQTFAGQAICGSESVDEPGFTILQSAPSLYTVATAGVITSWRTQLDPTTDVTMAFKTGRRATQPSSDGETPGTYVVTGSGSTVVVPAGTDLFQQSVRIPVQAGDAIGFFADLDASQSACARFGEDENATYRVSGAVGNVGVGGSLGDDNFPVEYNVAATVEPDADGDGFGDTTQDQCSTQAATQGACVVPPVVTPPVAPAPAPKATAFTAAKAPAAAGKAKVGKKVKVVNATTTSFVPAASKVKIQWFRGAQKIKGAKKASYKVTRADAGKKLKATIKVSGSVPTKTFTVSTKKVTG